MCSIGNNSAAIGLRTSSCRTWALVLNVGALDHSISSRGATARARENMGWLQAPAWRKAINRGPVVEVYFEVGSSGAAARSEKVRERGRAEQGLLEAACRHSLLSKLCGWRSNACRGGSWETEESCFLLCDLVWTRVPRWSFPNNI